MTGKITAKKHGLLSRLMPVLALGLLPPADSIAGTYIFAGEANGADIITHPSGYTGSGGILTVRVCIDPLSINAAAMEIPVQNNINIYNRLQPTTGNLFLGGSNNVPASQVDFESVSLHELGHCLGLGHVNAASESGLTGNNRNYTKATDGANNVFNINAGSDGIIGSSDDIRGDDVNLHWYRKSNNNPFSIDNPVDSTTYARDLADLQALGHNFAANADRAVGALLGVPNTEAVMQQGTFNDEAQRTLAHDDVATLLYAASGENERAGIGVPDDYTINLEYGGINSSNCDISLSITNTNSLAFCSVGGAGIAPNHVRITSGSIEFGSAFSWFFNTDTSNQAPVLAPIGNQSVIEGQSLSVGITATDADGDTLQFNPTGLPAFATFTNTGNGAATLDIMPAAGASGTYPVTINVTDSGLPVLADSETFDIIVNNPAIDSDGDGLSDTFETTVLFTNPNNVDTDGDGLADGAGGVVPLASLPGGIDVDSDGFVDGEQDLGTDPVAEDTDGDQLPDGLEVANNADPLDPGSWPTLADGDIAPLGQPDGILNAADYLIMQRIVLQHLTPNPLEYAHGDLYPVGSPDGVIDTSDLLLLLEMIMSAP